MAHFNYMTLQIDGKEPVPVRSCSVSGHRYLEPSRYQQLFQPAMSEITVEMDFEPDGAEIIQSAMGNVVDLKLKDSNREMDFRDCHFASYNYYNSSPNHGFGEPYRTLQLSWNVPIRMATQEPTDHQTTNPIPQPVKIQRKNKRKIDWLRTGF